MRSFEHNYLLEQPISHELLKMVRLIGEYRGRQDLYRRQSPEVLETLRRVAMVQSVESSNRIEGIVAGAGRVEALVEGRTKPKDRSEAEIAGYKDVLADIHAHPGAWNLTPELILDFHRRMLALTPEKGGIWKQKDNAIIEVDASGVQKLRFRPVSSAATPEFIETLCRLYRQAVQDRQAKPLSLIPSFILDYECIHPFWDGNGRTGRLLTLMLLYQEGYEVGRYISLERIIEQTKEGGYYDSLQKSSQNWHEGRHDLRPWWTYFLGVLIAAYKEFEERAGQLAGGRGAKKEMVKNMALRLPSPFRFGDLQRVCPEVSHPTLKQALDELRRKGSVRCLGKGANAAWERTVSREP